MTGSTISRRYAKALLSIGREDGKYEDYGRDLQAFGALCAENRELFQVLSNRLFSLEDRKAILEAVGRKAGFSVTVKNFLRLLVDKKRIGAIGAIADHYTRMTDEISHVTRAEIVTAKPLKGDALKTLEKALAKLTSMTVRTEVREDASLVGGLVVKIGDLVLDGSVKAQLEGLRESLKRGGYH